MSSIYSFVPIETEHAGILILGSMPSEASLLAGEYYAHPRNHFWRVMGALLAVDAEATYAQRLLALNNAGIALWDVLHSCIREGSLDSAIDKASQIPNDFQSFFTHHTKITRVYFNGSMAEQIYRKRVLPFLKVQPLEYLRLPSTSPAHAALSFERKLEAWKPII